VIPVEQCLLLYSSLSQVQRVKRRLLEKGIFVDMLRAPQCLARRGCAFALRCAPAVAPLVRDVSRELAIEIQGSFLEPAAGADRLYTPWAYGPVG